MSEFKRIDEETISDYLIRIGKEYKKLGWNKIGDILNDMTGQDYSPDKWRKTFQKHVNPEYNYRYLKDTVDFIRNDIPSKDDKMNELKEKVKDFDRQKDNLKKEADELRKQRDELHKERIKFSEEKKEYNRWLREESRDEQITERICNAVRETTPLQFPSIKIDTKINNKSYALVFSDAHYGCEFEIPGLYGDILNSYSPEEFESRMNFLLNKTIEYIMKEEIDTLNVFDLGDSTDGMLRVGQIWKLRYGVVEAAIQYANYISSWLNELSKYVNVRFQMTNGNHTELRQLGQPKGTFIKDNMGFVIKEFIKAKLEGNKNFTFIDNPTGYVYAQLSGNTFLGIHGEVKNMETALKDLSRIYGVNIDYLCAGHLHHSKSNEIGVRSEVINVPSIIGMDDYSLSLRKAADAGAKILTFDQAFGLINDYRIKLN